MHGTEAHQYASSSRASSSAQIEKRATTISDAAQRLAGIHGHLCEAADLAETIANALAGPAPERAGVAPDAGPQTPSLVDYLNERANDLRLPAQRIVEALQRIQSRLS